MSIEETLIEIFQDRDLFMDLVGQFIEMACEDDPNDTEKYEDKLKELYREYLKAIVEKNTAYVYEESGSPIETIFLNSLILCFIKCDSFGLVMHPVKSNAEKEISDFLGYFNKFNEFISWYKHKFSSVEGIKDYLDSQVESGKMEPEERLRINNLMARYHYLPLSESYHLTLHPSLPDIKIDGKSIRPAMLFWIPKEPQIKVIVECNDFDYHSDKRKFACDRKRDRAVQVKGYQILRYSGTEIYKNPVGTSSDLAHFLWDQKNSAITNKVRLCEERTTI